MYKNKHKSKFNKQSLIFFVMIFVWMKVMGSTIEEKEFNLEGFENRKKTVFTLYSISSGGYLSGGKHNSDFVYLIGSKNREKDTSLHWVFEYEKGYRMLKCVQTNEYLFYNELHNENRCYGSGFKVVTHPKSFQKKLPPENCYWDISKDHDTYIFNAALNSERYLDGRHERGHPALITPRGGSNLDYWRWIIQSINHQ